MKSHQHILSEDAQVSGDICQLGNNLRSDITNSGGSTSGDRQNANNPRSATNNTPHRSDWIPYDRDDSRDHVSATSDNQNDPISPDTTGSTSASEPSPAASAGNGSTPSDVSVAAGDAGNNTVSIDTGCGVIANDMPPVSAPSTDATTQGSDRRSAESRPSDTAPPVPAGTNAGTQDNTITAPAPLGDATANGPDISPATPDTTPPNVTDKLGLDGVTVTGGGDPGTAVTISENGKTVGTATGDTAGAWTFNAAALAPGSHSLVASETDAAGNTGSASPLAVTIVDPRFHVVHTATSDSVLLHGVDYAGPVNHLQASYDNTGTGPSVISALVGNVFIQAGAGENAAAAKDGSNVLAGGAGSNWLVGGTGADGGTDTFFLSAQDQQPAWDTLLNFHVGDMLTLWGFDKTNGSTASVGTQGANSAEGETISVDFGKGSGPSTLVTFAGVSPSAQFSSMTGSTGGLDFCMLTRTA